LNQKFKMTEENETKNVRVSMKLVDYVEHIRKRFKEQYGINVTFIEASNLLVGRAKENNLF